MLTLAIKRVMDLKQVLLIDKKGKWNGEPNHSAYFFVAILYHLY